MDNPTAAPFFWGLQPANAPGGGTVAYSINDEGVVAGYFTDAKFVQHAFLRDEDGKFTTFDAPGAAYSTVARAINAQGLVAGYFSDSHGMARGFVRDKHGNFLTLGALVTSLNARGGIAGYYSAPIR
jgi:probable HAF family extracellular repeat protein